MKIKVFLLSLVIGLLVASPVVAAMSNPDYIRIEDIPPQEGMGVFRDLWEEDDQLFFMRYDVSYATDPSMDASDTFLMALYDTDGTTLLYSRALNYYQHNILSLYLTADQAVTWEGSYVVRLMGNPAIFDPLIEDLNMDTRVLGAGDYYEFDDLRTFLTQQAEELENDWGITLLSAEYRLNVTGAVFFEEAIPGLSQLLPDFFQITTTYLDVNRTTWNHAYEQDLMDHRGGRLDDAFANLSFWLTGNTDAKDWMGVGFTALLCVTVGGLVYPATKNPGWPLLFSAMTLPVCVWVGLLEFSILAIIIFFVVLLFGILFIMGRLG